MTSNRKRKTSNDFLQGPILVMLLNPCQRTANGFRINLLHNIHVPHSLPSSQKYVLQQKGTTTAGNISSKTAHVPSLVA